MIQISKIDNNLSIYKQNNVIIFGNGEQTKAISDILKAHEIVISSICDSSRGSGQLDGVDLISLDDLLNLDLENTVIQLATTCSPLIEAKVSKDKIISFDEAVQVVCFLDKLEYSKHSPHLLEQSKKRNKLLKTNETKKIQDNLINARENLVMLCLPPKTGDHTLIETFGEIGLPFHMLWHTPSMFLKEDLLKKNVPLKIITAVREPISRDISTLYQGLEFIFSSPLIDSLELHDKSTNVMTNGGDAQEIFDLKFNCKDGATPMVEFFENFSENIIDLTKHPFNVNDGYTIVKDGNIEVFVYQLEKLDSLTKQMGDWLGVTIDTFTRGNTSENKWVAPSYQLAKNNMLINKDYLENSYSSNWVKHFYSSDDIDKFKARWEKNLK